MSKKLVAYFSASGVTETAAKRLAQAIGADLFEIAPKTPYTAADLDWTNSKSRSSMEMKDVNSRPQMKESLKCTENYGTVFIGFPVWWYTAPRIINTFIESCDLDKKTVAFFATSGGSGIEKADREFAALYPNADWKPGKLVNRLTDEELAEWAKSV